MPAWKVTEIKPDTPLLAVSLAFPGENCNAMHCAEHLFVGWQTLQLAIRSGRKGRRAVPRARQLDNALNARAVMSSTPPIPLIMRYLGAESGDDAAQLA